VKWFHFHLEHAGKLMIPFLQISEIALNSNSAGAALEEPALSEPSFSTLKRYRWRMRAASAQSAEIEAAAFPPTSAPFGGIIWL
jgi:hypothetical protein